ncbi:MAG: hypothetical protein HC769_10285 [Cyanobacteria bacterium CRU_2_1]|nr:hypothetical protein [Cyanobacteria bacterium RU_5_0]NJR59196.1 hypothetical protein [Cyanobacteria bacterium CRU_2_1]
MSVPILSYVVVVTLLCWWLILPTVNSLNIPIGETHGIISYIVTLGRSPLTNIAIYLLLILIPNLAIVILEFFRSQVIEGNEFLEEAKGTWNLNILEKPKILSSFVLTGILVWILNIGRPTSEFFTAVARDGFHFGEKIGVSETFLQEPRAFFERGYILIHGFGQNVLPGIIGEFLGGSSKDITFSILVVYLQSLASIVISFLILVEIAAFISEKHKWKVLLILSLIYFALHGIVFGLIDRDTFFILQLFLAIRWVRLSLTSIENERNLSRSQFIYPALLGASIPISFLYVYDRAIYFVLIFIYLFGYFLITKSRAYFFKSSTISISALGLTSILLSLLFGFSTLPTSIAQVRYWMKVSGLFTSLPYPAITVSIGSLIDWLPILLQSVVMAILWLKFRAECFVSNKKFKTFLSENSVPILLLLSAALFMRVALGRSDGGHLISPGFFAIFAFVALIGYHTLGQTTSRIPWLQLLSIVFVAASFINMNSVFSAANLQGAFDFPAAVHSIISQENAKLLNPEYLDTANQIQPELKGQSCFYTLTSEGIWYRILATRPCSKYWYLIYSTSHETQKDLVKDLEEMKPRVILYSNGSLGNQIDGISKETSHLLVHQYVWQNYRPYMLIHGNWFWVRRESEVKLSDLLVPRSDSEQAVGHFDALAPSSTNSKLNVVASGWSVAPNGQVPNENVVLLTFNSVGKSGKLALLGAALASIERRDVVAVLNRHDALQSGWNITFNKLNLPPGDVKIRAWAYNSTEQKFYQLPRSHTLSVEENL